MKYRLFYVEYVSNKVPDKIFVLLDENQHVDMIRNYMSHCFSRIINDDPNIFISWVKEFKEEDLKESLAGIYVEATRRIMLFEDTTHIWIIREYEKPNLDIFNYIKNKKVKLLSVPVTGGINKEFNISTIEKILCIRNENIDCSNTYINDNTDYEFLVDCMKSWIDEGNLYVILIDDGVLIEYIVHLIKVINERELHVPVFIKSTGLYSVSVHGDTITYNKVNVYDK